MPRNAEIVRAVLTTLVVSAFWLALGLVAGLLG